MKKNNLILMLGLVLMYQNVSAKDQGLYLKKSRSNYFERIKIKSNFDILALQSTSSLAEYLNRKGIHLDDQSEIQIHNEKNYIDLSCFNCIIVSIDAKQDIEATDNERGRTTV